MERIEVLDMSHLAEEIVVPTCESEPDVHSSSELYARRFSGAVGEWMLSIQKAIILRRLRALHISSVLDVGGGHAQLTPGLIEAGFKVTVLGSTEGCAQRLRGFLERKECAFQVGSLTRLPFPDKSFDAVVCVRQISHVKDWELFVAELSRVARNAVIVDYPPLRSFNVLSNALFFLKSHFESHTTRPYKIFGDREIVGAFSKRGYRPLGYDRQFFLPMVFHRMCKSRWLSSSLEGCFRVIGFTCLFGSPVILTLVPSL